MKSAISVICLISAGVLGFLTWLIYFQESAAPVQGDTRAFIPAMNAVFNCVSAACITLGILFIKSGNRKWHAVMMIAATLSSACFLAGYVYYHYTAEHTQFLAEGMIRPLYFFILITHIVLAAVVLPMILTTLYCAVSKRFDLHKKVARFTYPIWLYVSVTGVLIFAILELFNTPL